MFSRTFLDEGCTHTHARTRGSDVKKIKNNYKVDIAENIQV